MPAEVIYASPGATIAIGRQSAAGTPRVVGLYKLLLTQASPKIPSNISSLGIEVGSGYISESRAVKESLMPAIDLSGHMRVGAMLNILCASGFMMLSKGTDPGSAVTTTLNGAISTRHAASAVLTDASGLSVGDWVQIGALAGSTPVVTDKVETHEIKTIVSNTVTFVGKLLYTWADTTAVKKIDSAKANTNYFLPVQPDNSAKGAGDLWTVYASWSNGTNTNSLLFYDCAATGLNQSYQTGNIATFQSGIKALNVDNTGATLANVTLRSDPSSKTVNNTRGSCTIAGNSTDVPRQVNLNLACEVFDDVILTQYVKQSAVIIARTLSIGTGGKFVKDFWDKLNFVSNVVTDAIYESAFGFTAASPVVVGTSSTAHSFTLTSPDTQFANYDPTFNTNQPVDANIEMGKVVRNPTTDSENWYFTAVSGCTSDVYSAA